MNEQIERLITLVAQLTKERDEISAAYVKLHKLYLATIDGIEAEHEHQL